MAGSTMSPAAAPAALGGAFFLGPDTNFRITAFNSAAGVVLTIAGQVLDVDGRVYPFVHTHTPNTDRSISSQVLPMGTGWILNAEMFASSGTPRRGQCFARLELVQGREGAVTSLGTLLQGYVADTTVMAYPGSALIGSTRDSGVIRSITGTDPAAGVEISETVPTNARWRLLQFAASFTTDATVANRESQLIIDDGTTKYNHFPVHATQAASIVASVVLWRGIQSPGGGSSLRAIIGAMDIVMMGGHRFRTSTINLAAGDNYGAPQYLVEEWIED